MSNNEEKVRSRRQAASKAHAVPDHEPADFLHDDRNLFQNEQVKNRKNCVLCFEVWDLPPFKLTKLAGTANVFVSIPNNENITPILMSQERVAVEVINKISSTDTVVKTWMKSIAEYLYYIFQKHHTTAYFTSKT